MTDIAAGRYDAGVRFGGGKDMIAVPISPDARFGLVAPPGHFSKHGIPELPQDLTASYVH